MHIFSRLAHKQNGMLVNKKSRWVCDFFSLFSIFFFQRKKYYAFIHWNFSKYDSHAHPAKPTRRKRKKKHLKSFQTQRFVFVCFQGCDSLIMILCDVWWLVADVKMKMKWPLTRRIKFIGFWFDGKLIDTNSVKTVPFIPYAFGL